MQSKVPVLRHLELDAFLVTAFTPDPEYSQELQVYNFSTMTRYSNWSKMGPIFIG